MTSYLTNAAPAPSVDYLVTSLLFPGLNTNGTALLTTSGTDSPSTAYLTNGAGKLTLVLPVNTTNSTTLGGDPTTVILQGQVVATAPATAWPLQVSMELQAGQVTLTWPSLPRPELRCAEQAGLECFVGSGGWDHNGAFQHDNLDGQCGRAGWLLSGGRVLLTWLLRHAL